VQTAPRVFAGVSDLESEVGHELGASDWHELTQAEVLMFAEATGDRQWIHTDPERAASGPFGRPIAHGYYLLSLLPVLLAEVFTIEEAGALINLGVDQLRFHRPVPVGARFRAVARLDEVVKRGRRGVAELALAVDLCLEGGSAPVMTAIVRQMVRPPMAWSGSSPTAGLPAQAGDGRRAR
jgi:acyl dehydratase